ncbi:MAG: DUF342 domain-containing protein [Spirochaetales bacterium]|nr:DUF342 domain-containing protein [Spirochaetales bacterium]
MAHKIAISSNSMEDALNKARRYLHADSIDQIDYEIAENDGSRIKILCCIKDTKSDTEPDHNGYFKIFYRDGFAYLIVYPPVGIGRPVYEDDVINRMKLLNIPSASPLFIRDIIDRARQIPEKLAEWPMGAEFRANIGITVSEDKMSAIMNIQPPLRGGASPTADEILFAAEDYGICYGIDRQLISRIAEQHLYNEDFVIAEGLRPVAPIVNQINYHFDTDVCRPFLTDEYGRVNLKELNFIQEKKKGDVLADIADPKPGTDGIDVFGEIVPAEHLEQTVRLLPGDNTELSPDGHSLLASIDGYVVLHGSMVSVREVVHVENVDYSTGNIDFEGAVVVAGTVADGFTVKATDSIQVGSCVGKVHLESDGDIILKSGINGSGEGTIKCRGDLYTRFAENAHIETQGSFFGEESLMNCTTEVDRNLVLIGRRAEIVGGRTVVGGSIRCKKIGSAAGIKTPVCVGILPEKFRTIDNLQQRINDNKLMLSRLQQSMTNLTRDIQNGKITEDEAAENKNKILKVQYRFEDELRELERDYNDGKLMMQAENTRYVVAENEICQGTTVTFGKVEYAVTNIDMSSIVLRYINERVIESGYDPQHLPECFGGHEQGDSV